jgi:hypothetical protein
MKMNKSIIIFGLILQTALSVHAVGTHQGLCPSMLEENRNKRVTLRGYERILSLLPQEVRSHDTIAKQLAKQTTTPWAVYSLLRENSDLDNLKTPKLQHILMWCADRICTKGKQSN